MYVPLSSLPLPFADTLPFPTPLLLTERLVERAGGTRFVKGLKGEDFHNWRGVCEGLRASREDIESVEARLDEDVRQFEQGVRTADVTTAAHKVTWQTDGRWQRTPKNTIHQNSSLCIFRDAYFPRRVVIMLRRLGRQVALAFALHWQGSERHSRVAFELNHG